MKNLSTLTAYMFFYVEPFVEPFVEPTSIRLVLCNL